MPGTMAHKSLEAWLSQTGTDAQHAPEYSLDSENRAVAMEIAQAYEITKLPTIVLLDGQGQLIEKFVGDLQEERVRSKLDEMANAN